ESDEKDDDDATTSVTSRAVPNVPDRPDEIIPAGRQLVQPTKAKLTGPKVIRVDKPEPLPPPRSDRRRGPSIGMGSPRAGQGVGGGGPEMPPDGRGGGRGAGRGGARGGGPGSSARRNTRRSASAGNTDAVRSRSQNTEDRGANWRKQDLVEREQRLTRSGGMFKNWRRDNIRRASTMGRGGTVARPEGPIKISAPLSIKELSAATGVKAIDIVKRLFLDQKAMLNVNSTINGTMATEVMVAFDIELDVNEELSAQDQIVEQFKDRTMSDERSRSPVVTILGHVDHGKTSLLDRIRKANVASGEAGGITQATSAFQVPVHAGDADKMITFIDTPGHEAFTEMRARGAKVTDLVVLVVAADDGVMPQTIESINHAKAAGVPIIVALNKIDKPEATDSNIQRILGELAQHELNPTEWGGTTEIVRTSALKDIGIQDLLDVIDFQAQLLDGTADFDGPAEGTVLEARLEEGRGAVAQVIVQQGRLKKGDYLAIGRAFGRVRDIVDDRGRRIDEAGPSSAVALSGINEVPDPGDKFFVVKNLREAESAATERRAAERERTLARDRVTLDNIFEKLAESGRKELPLIVTADVNGSVETLMATLTKISTDDVTIIVKHAAVGGISDSDILLAEATGAIIIGFNVTIAAKSRKLAEAKGIDVRLYDVIYDITDDVTRAAEGLLDPEHRLEVLGHAEVRDVFRISKVGMVAGCYVTDGVIQRNAQIRVTRDGIVIEKDRRLEQLKRFKDDAKEVRNGQECGMKIDGYDDIRTGDILECYRTQEVRRSLRG
ncbi:MAG: translation initiation factor IF-2, partial [Phycisphaerales bacterium]|nr:translation initiation factor IF-2 [Phycisphaerales bacterium]